MRPIDPPIWNPEQLESERLRAIALFRKARTEEPLEAYLDAFDEYQEAIEELMEITIDLHQVEETSVEVLTNAKLLEAFRYLSGPPISFDDLKTLADAVPTPARLKSNSNLRKAIVNIVIDQIDRRRFPWLHETREPTETERHAAVLASAAMMAMRRLETHRRHSDKNEQEIKVTQALVEAGLQQVKPRNISSLNQAPSKGQFCRESAVGNRKADFVIGLWDERKMALECKVSNSALNSVKRLNNDAAAKAEAWKRDFGTLQIVPVAVLSGVYNLHNLLDAQNRGLTLFWAHELNAMLDWIEKARI